MPWSSPHRDLLSYENTGIGPVFRVDPESTSLGSLPWQGRRCEHANRSRITAPILYVRSVLSR